MKQILRVYDVTPYTPEEAFNTFGDDNKDIEYYYSWHAIAIIDDERIAETVKARLNAEIQEQDYPIEFDLKPLSYWKTDQLVDVYLQIQKISTGDSRNTFLAYQSRCNQIIEAIKAVSADETEQPKMQPNESQKYLSPSDYLADVSGQINEFVVGNPANKNKFCVHIKKVIQKAEEYGQYLRAEWQKAKQAGLTQCDENKDKEKWFWWTALANDFMGNELVYFADDEFLEVKFYMEGKPKPDPLSYLSSMIWGCVGGNYEGLDLLDYQFVLLATIHDAQNCQAGGERIYFNRLGKKTLSDRLCQVVWKRLEKYLYPYEFKNVQKTIETALLAVKADLQKQADLIARTNPAGGGGAGGSSKEEKAALHKETCDSPLIKAGGNIIAGGDIIIGGDNFKNQATQNIALEDKRKTTETDIENNKKRSDRDGIIEPKPPEILGKILWVCRYGRKWWWLLLLAMGVVSLPFLLKFAYNPESEKQSNSPQNQSQENKLQVTLKDICRDIDSRPLAQRNETAKQYIGITIKRERLRLQNISSNLGPENNAYTLQLTLPDEPAIPHSNRIISCDVSKDRYPELSIAKEGVEFYISGKIIEAYKNYIKLSDVSLEFN